MTDDELLSLYADKKRDAENSPQYLKDALRRVYEKGAADGVERAAQYVEGTEWRGGEETGRYEQRFLNGPTIARELRGLT